MKTSLIIIALLTGSYAQAAPIGNEAQSLDAIFGPGGAQLTLESAEAAHLRQGQAHDRPWSGSYWPSYLGGISFRYADPQFPRSPSWQINFDYAKAHPASSDLASPAEKYDRLFQQTQLSQAAWSNGADYLRRYGSVPLWVGLNHGWSSAAITQVEPSKSVTLTGVAGQLVTFTPEDIKALASQLWANESGTVAFLGSRCSNPHPAQDPAGRVLEASCFDPNPAAFHIALAKQVGERAKSLIADADPSVEVWNFPVAAYSYRYFNPRTGESTDSLSDARISLKGYEDPFHAYRDPSAAAIVGIEMQVTYVLPTAATSGGGAAPLRTDQYRYDLELSESGELLGGEWRGSARPDFIWFPNSSHAQTTQDDQLNAADWAPGAPVPVSWSTQAEAAAKNGSPLAAIIDRLLSLSAK